jgi:hypothetical protein
MESDKTEKVERVEKRFSFHVFFINLSSRKLWVWLLSSYFVRDILVKNGDHPYFYHLIIIWGIISVIYLIGEPLEKGIGIMFENAKLSAEIKAGAQASISTDTAKVKEAIKSSGGKNE